MPIQVVPAPAPVPSPPEQSDAQQRAELAEALVAIRRASASPLLPDHAQAAVGATASLLELFAPSSVLTAVGGES